MWRSQIGKGIRCDVCLFAFLYESETMLVCDRLKLALARSSRALILLIGCVCYMALRGSRDSEQGSFCILTTGMIMAEGLRLAAERSPRAIMMWIIGCMGYVLMESRQLNMETPFPIILLVFVIQDGLMDLHDSLVEPYMGSLGYSVKRMRAGSGARAMDLWELHKIEWARAGVYPMEHSPFRLKTCEDHCKESLRFFVLLFGFYLSTCFMVWASIAPAIGRWLISSTGRAVVLALLMIGAGYLVTAIVLHTVSALMVPPIQLRTDVDGGPLVRSLHESETRRQVSQ